MVIDVVTFNGEYDLFELRYQILKDYVDEFIVVEFDKTFSGKDKPCYVIESKNHFYEPIDKWPKVRFCPVDEVRWSKYLEMAQQSPNTKGAEHWKTEFAQKESIKDCLTHLKDDDFVFVGDCDEIWNPKCLPQNTGYRLDTTYKFEQTVFVYSLNNKSSEKWYGTRAMSYFFIRVGCLNHIRSEHPSYPIQSPVENGGWHFTSMGGYEEVKRKLSDSYTRESYWTEGVEAHLKENIEGVRDFLGRDFTYKVDESDWPDYLKQNKEKYKHLCL